MAYETVNQTWPEVMPKAMTEQEAISAARKLYRFGMGRAFRGQVKITSGRRYSWVRYGVLWVNYTGHWRGPWKDLVHDLSHYCHRRKHHNIKPHDSRHAFMEREMINLVVSKGWLNGTLKREDKPEVPKDLIHIARLAAGIKRWEAKEKRAHNAIKKLTKRLRYYQKKAGAANE